MKFQSDILKNYYKKIHFIGIGGISMSGLAEILQNMGYSISGSDMKDSEIAEKLRNEGMEIHIGHDAQNVIGSDLVIYTAAVKNDNPEMIEAKKLGIPTIERAVLLGEIMKKYSIGIAISGTHGKTTTTSMVATIMLEAEKNPTIHIGGVLDSIGGNTYIGGEEFFVTEACEYVESFLHFNPFLALVLNIELDHVDYFKDFNHFRSAFEKFIALVPKNGYVVGCIDDINTREVLSKVTSCNVITYGMNSGDAMWSARDIETKENGCSKFTLLHNGIEMCKIEVGVPGNHNINNALGAISSCFTLGCSLEAIAAGIKKYTGTHKRFEYKGTKNGVKVVDDYAHHPTAVKATLQSAKNTSSKRIWSIFQPHTYSRTKAFIDEFADSFGNADKIIIADIYAAREKDTGEVHSSMLAKKLQERGKDAIYINGFDAICKHLDENTIEGDLVLTMGAGDIYKVGEMFVKGK